LSFKIHAGGVDELAPTLVVSQQGIKVIRKKSFKLFPMLMEDVKGSVEVLNLPTFGLWQKSA
jgi:hypothetical protein